MSREAWMKSVQFCAAACAIAVLAACQSEPAGGEVEASGWAGSTLAADPEQVAAGQEIAQQQCAQCHAIDRTSKSPNATAPPLRDVLSVNDADNLAYRFIEAMRVGHDEMPLFDFDVRAADSLIAYIVSVSE